MKRLVLLLILPLLLPACSGDGGQEEAYHADESSAVTESLLTVGGSLERGETPMGWALRRGLERGTAHAILTALTPLLPPSKYRTDDSLELVLNGSGDPLRFAVTRRHRERFVVKRGEDGSWVSFRESKPLRREIIRFEGIIRSSLWESLRSTGVSANLIISFADIFSWTFDFLTDCRNGDSFEFMVEAFYEGESFDHYGYVLVARYDGERGKVAGVRFQPEGGRASYYAQDGTSLRKIFLRSPLNYRRISSRFSRSRFHPILKRRRPHLGIDYAAASGTPVVTVGDGTVIFAGWKGGFGNYIEVRHNRSYTTCYGHLSRFAKGVHKGRRVAQGKVIGFVGSTGLSTGPHLDFRMRRGGTYVNPLAVNVPSADPVPKESLQSFFFVSRVHFAALDFLPAGSTEGRDDEFTLALLAGAGSGCLSLAPYTHDQPLP